MNIFEKTNQALIDSRKEIEQLDYKAKYQFNKKQSQHKQILSEEQKDTEQLTLGVQ
jgi:ribosomal protein S4